MRAVVDADYLVYSCGFAVEKTWYDVSVQRPDGSTEQAMYRTRDEAEAWLSFEPEGSETVLDKIVEAEPLANALFLVGRTLGGIDSALTERGIEFDALDLFLTGKGNFREALATIKGYKANRDPGHRPVHYKSIRRYLINRWGAKVVDGIEADDAVAMEAHALGYDPDRIIIVTCDKDLLTVPGLQYNFQKRKFVTVTPDEASMNFYRQLITGDTTDNIGGAFRAGAKLADKIIVPGQSEHDRYMACLVAYQKGKDYKGCPYANLSAAEALLENARLLHLKRFAGDVWQPPSSVLASNAA
jgi:DNA polymerase-1